MCADILSPVKR